MRKGRSCIAILSAVILAVTPTLFASASSLGEAEQEKAALEQELKEAQNLIDGLKDSKDDIQTKVTQLDQKLTDISGRIQNLETQLEQKNTQIETTKEQLQEATQDEKSQYEQMKKRIRYMYENSNNMSLLESLFSAGNLAEFINQAENIREIMSYDRDMLKKYQDTQQMVADTKGTLEQDYEDLRQMKAQVQQEQDTVKSLLAAKEQELTKVSGELTTAQSSADEVAAEIQAQEDIIAQIQAEERRKQEERAELERQREAARQEEERRRQEEEAGQDGTEQPSEPSEAEDPDDGGCEEPEIPDDIYNGGVFAWPCPSSTRVTSDYGTRLSPIAGASSNHKGIDIGAAYGSAIVAAADGTVSFAGYGNAMGNYIMISHGSGIYTVYCHCSALLVSAGMQVTKGQTIAQVGSTGISTGAHLHFGVTENGSFVSPWNYLRQ